MRHHHTPLSKARYWLEQARDAIGLQRPILAIEPSHTAVHNAVIALRNFLSDERGKVRHEDVAPLALLFGVPKPLAGGVDRVESLKPPYEYGVQVPTEETGVQFHRVAEAIVAHVERAIQGRGQKLPSKPGRKK